MMKNGILIRTNELIMFFFNSSQVFFNLSKFFFFCFFVKMFKEAIIKEDELLEFALKENHLKENSNEEEEENDFAVIRDISILNDILSRFDIPEKLKNFPPKIQECLHNPNILSDNIELIFDYYSIFQIICLPLLNNIPRNKEKPDESYIIILLKIGLILSALTIFAEDFASYLCESDYFNQLFLFFSHYPKSQSGIICLKTLKNIAIISEEYRDEVLSKIDISMLSHFIAPGNGPETCQTIISFLKGILNFPLEDYDDLLSEEDKPQIEIIGELISRKFFHMIHFDVIKTLEIVNELAEYSCFFQMFESNGNTRILFQELLSGSPKIWNLCYSILVQFPNDILSLEFFASHKEISIHDKNIKIYHPESIREIPLVIKQVINHLHFPDKKISKNASLFLRHIIQSSHLTADAKILIIQLIFEQIREQKLVTKIAMIEILSFLLQHSEPNLIKIAITNGLGDLLQDMFDIDDNNLRTQILQLLEYCANVEIEQNSSNSLIKSFLNDPDIIDIICSMKETTSIETQKYIKTFLNFIQQIIP